MSKAFCASCGADTTGKEVSFLDVFDFFDRIEMFESTARVYSLPNTSMPFPCPRQ